MTHLKRRNIIAAAMSVPFWRTGTSLADPSTIYDVIVVGGGTAGIPCALFAAMGGARVLLIEKSPALGGTLFWSTGQIAGRGPSSSRGWGSSTHRISTSTTACALTSTLPMQP